MNTPMEWPEEGRKEFIAAYLKAQLEMGAVTKNASNPAFKSKYADLATVLDAILPAFHKNGLIVIQSPSYDGDALSVETIIAHTGGGHIRSTLSVRPSKHDPQGVGSAETYCRRYALLALAGVAPEDDDGNAASGPRTAEPRKFQPSETMAPERKSSAQAKRDGDHERLKDQINNQRTERDLDDWYADFERGEARVLPLSWGEAIRDIVEQRRNDILDVMASA